MVHPQASVLGLLGSLLASRVIHDESLNLPTIVLIPRNHGLSPQTLPPMSAPKSYMKVPNDAQRLAQEKREKRYKRHRRV